MQESDQISFLWRLLHNLLQTQSRVSRILQQQDSSCKSCHHPLDDLPHLFNCTSSSLVCNTLLRTLRTLQPNITTQQIMLLSLDIEPAMEFPAVWLVSSTLLYVWLQKSAKKQCRLVEVRSNLEARVNMLRRGRKNQNAATILDELMLNFY